MGKLSEVVSSPVMTTEFLESKIIPSK